LIYTHDIELCVAFGDDSSNHFNFGKAITNENAKNIGTDTRNNILYLTLLNYFDIRNIG
jgi:hypothetical protein